MSTNALASGPRRLGRYVLWRELAAGGMATVHLGRMLGHAGFGKTVAIKQMRSDLVEDEDFVGMFLDEARITSRLDHPNVVMALDVVEEEKPHSLFLVMEYVHGGALSAALRVVVRRQEWIPIPVSIAMMAGALRGLHAAHEAKTDDGSPLMIIHRDVSPHNIFVSVDGVAKIGDFGIAKAAGQIHSTNEGVLKGKHSYMAPEQARGERLTPKADIFAAGLVLWELLVGRRMIDGESSLSRLNALINLKAEAPSKFNPAVTPALDAIVLKSLAPRPDDRFESAAAMADALEAVVAPAPPSVVGNWCRATLSDLIQKREAMLAEMRQWSTSSAAQEMTSVAVPETTTSRKYRLSSSSIHVPTPPPMPVTPVVPDDLVTEKSETQGAIATDSRPSKRPQATGGSSRLRLGYLLAMASMGGILLAVLTILIMKGAFSSSSSSSSTERSANAAPPAASPTPAPTPQPTPTTAPTPTPTPSPSIVEIDPAPSASTAAKTTPPPIKPATTKPAAAGGPKCRVVTTQSPSGQLIFKDVCDK